MEDLALGGRLDSVCMHIIHCYEPGERLYCFVGTYEPICIFCCSNINLITKEDCYPQCSQCLDKDPFNKRK